MCQTFHPLLDVAFFNALPVLGAFVLYFWAARRVLVRYNLSKSYALVWVLAAMAHAATALVIAEIASQITRLNGPVLLGMWTGFDVILGFGLYRWLRPRLCDVKTGLSNLGQELARAFREQTFIARCMTGCTVVFLLWLGFCAWVTPTVVWDSHTYHMPRVMHWLQAQNMEHYSTSIQRQIESSPGMETFVVQLMALTGNETLANFPAWWALITATLAVTFITRSLLAGSPRKKKVGALESVPTVVTLAALIVVTIPDGVSEAITTQNDTLVAAAVASVIAFGIAQISIPRSWILMVATAISFGVAVAIKPTAFIYLSFFGVFWAIGLLRKNAISTLFKNAVVALFAILVIDGGWMWRNYHSFGHPLGSKTMFRIQTNAKITPGRVAANTIRNISLYSRTPSPTVTAAFNMALSTGILALGQDVHDPNCIFETTKFYFQPSSGPSAGGGLGNCYTALLLVGAVVLLPFYFKRRSLLTVYTLAGILSFVFFCGYLRWQPWHFRLHIAFFIVAAPVIAIVVTAVINRWVILALALLLTVNAILISAVNPSLPTLASISGNREHLMFAANPKNEASTLSLVQFILDSHATNIYVKLDDDCWEYPIWVCLRNRGFRGQIEHAFVENETKNIAPVIPKPGGLIVDGRIKPQP